MKTIAMARGSMVFFLLGAVGLAVGGIKGSKHDFSNKSWSSGDACAACHSPHRSVAPDSAPLWDPNADLTRVFDSGNGEAPSPGRGTQVCLRCHDGTVAPEVITGVKGERFKHQQHPGLWWAGKGTTDHPVGIAYPQIDDGFRPLASVLASGKVTLPDGKVECVSCHDPHDQSGEEKMLVMSNARSALCLACHRK